MRMVREKNGVVEELEDGHGPSSEEPMVSLTSWMSTTKIGTGTRPGLGFELGCKSDEFVEVKDI